MCWFSFRIFFFRRFRHDTLWEIRFFLNNSDTKGLSLTREVTRRRIGSSARGSSSSLSSSLIITLSIVSITMAFLSKSPSIYIVGAKRTPFGSFGGSLAKLSATELGVHSTKAALAQASVDPSTVGVSILISKSSSSSIPSPTYLMMSSLPQYLPHNNPGSLFRKRGRLIPRCSLFSAPCGSQMQLTGRNAGSDHKPTVWQWFRDYRAGCRSNNAW